ncbi:MAG: protein-L-isoaspartate(D-aspartate) O-methyltransferase [Sphingomonadaceae bacterium]
MAEAKEEFAKPRARMVERQIAARGISDPALLAAMRAVPRHRFVAPEIARHAYEDRPLPIGADQTISQPYIVALMIDAAELGPGDRVLEIGAGSGYAAAVMGMMADKVFAIERHEELAAAARRRIAELGFGNVEIVCGDGTRGLPEHAPFDAILVAAAGARVPEALRDQLAEGGRLVMPVGRRDVQKLVRIERTPRGFAERDLGGVRFVPLIGDPD